MELQEELLTEEELTLELAEKKAIAKESAKYSQAAMSGEDLARLKSTYKSNKSDAAEWTCWRCGGSKKHTDRTECPVWTAKCPCGIPHHFQHLCRNKGIPAPGRKGPENLQRKLTNLSLNKENQIEPNNRGHEEDEAAKERTDKLEGHVTTTSGYWMYPGGHYSQR